VLGLKKPIRAPKMFLGGFDPLNVERQQWDPQKAILVWKHITRRTDRRNRSTCEGAVPNKNCVISTDTCMCH